MSRCQACRCDSVTPGLSVGRHPVANRFSATADQVLAHHDLTLGQCGTCGLIQLVTPIPHSELRPPFPITYREPESHLDAVVEDLLRLPGLTSRSTVAGVTYKDRTTLDRFVRRDFASVWSLSLAEDLGVTDPCANIETVQKLLTRDVARDVARRRGQADLLIVRHIVEHVEDLAGFLDALHELVADGGYLMLEAPDCRANLLRRDYTMIWEEHSLYFTPETFAKLPSMAGFSLFSLQSHPFPYENCLIMVARKDGGARQISPPHAADIDLLAGYVRDFAPRTETFQRHFAAASARGTPFALYGAGHLSCSFINYHGLAPYVPFVADDTPEKQGLFLPGAGTPIIAGHRLGDERQVELCLFGLAPEIEDKIIANHSAYVARGGRFGSILPASTRFLLGVRPRNEIVRVDSED